MIHFNSMKERRHWRDKEIQKKMCSFPLLSRDDKWILGPYKFNVKIGISILNYFSIWKESFTSYLIIHQEVNAFLNFLQVPDKARDIMFACQNFNSRQKLRPLTNMSFSWNVDVTFRRSLKALDPSSPKCKWLGCTSILQDGCCFQWVAHWVLRSVGLQNHTWPFSHECKREKEKDKGWGSAPRAEASRLKKQFF